MLKLISLFCLLALASGMEFQIRVICSKIGRTDIIWFEHILFLVTNQALDKKEKIYSYEGGAISKFHLDFDADTRGYSAVQPRFIHNCTFDGQHRIQYSPYHQIQGTGKQRIYVELKDENEL